MENLRLHAATLISFLVLIFNGILQTLINIQKKFQMSNFCDTLNKNRSNDEYFYREISGLGELQAMYSYTIGFVHLPFAYIFPITLAVKP